VVLRRRPVGLVRDDDVELVEVPVPKLADGEALVRTDAIGIDAAVRTWLEDQPGYLPPVEIGDVVRAATVGEIVASRCPAYSVGDVVTTLGGFAEVSIARDDVFTTVVGSGQEAASVDREAMLAVYGSTGATAYFGMHDIGRPAPGETVVVSAAAGATGSIAGQIAKAAGARVVGIAGTEEKCRVVVEEFGFDACIDHRNHDLAAALREHCPARVDVYFDNVGGEILDAVLGRLAMHGRVVLCGVISSYLSGEHPGPSNYVKLLSMRGRMEGFNTLDNWDRYEEANAELRRLMDAGSLTYRVHAFDGLQRAVPALNALFEGTNIGKTFLRP
jgi:NADPH-dependent curcumin reductase CurA